MPVPQLAPHRDLKRLYDTREHAGWDLSGAGPIDDQGVLTSWHVTDHPHQVLYQLRRHGRIVAGYGPRGQSAELGPGLYFSDAPQLWVGRARNKWDFLTALSDAQLQRLCHRLRQQIMEQRQTRYITESERDSALRTLDNVEHDRYFAPLVRLADQPYNIRFWQPQYLAALHIPAGSQPQVIEAQLVGTFADLTGSHPDPKLLRALRHAGVAGAFIRHGMAEVGQMVLWEPRAVIDAHVIEYRGP